MGIDDTGPGEGQPEASDNEVKQAATIGENVGLEEGEIESGSRRTYEADLGLEAGSTGKGKGHANGDDLKSSIGGAETENVDIPADTELDMDLINSQREVHAQVGEVVTAVENVNSVSFGVLVENCSLDLSGESISRSPKKGGSHVSGIKRARTTYEQQRPSVHVSFNSLTRASKQKLEELLQEWSEWHARRDHSSLDSNEVLESGEETYFPALCVGIQKSSAVSFWIENQTSKQHDNGSVPLYDRGFAMGLTSADGPTNIEGGVEIVDDAARCFNCGSYSHSLKDCPKPRNQVAVSNARRQHKLRRNQNSGPQSAARYYLNASGGKYDGLKPGSLDGETRKLLGLAELDPPPWLDRMRELGYPPGYLDPDDEDQPSGITIFDDGDNQPEPEDGEIIVIDKIELPKKKSVEFPGINAPIPEKADERQWGVGSSGFDLRNRLQHKMKRSSEQSHRRHHPERRRFRDSVDDGPPGVDLAFSPPSSLPRYGNYEDRYISDSPRDMAPSFARSHSDRGRSTTEYEDFPSRGSSPYSSSSRRHSPKDLGSSSFEYESDGWRDRHSFHYSYRSNDDYDRHHHRSRR